MIFDQKITKKSLFSQFTTIIGPKKCHFLTIKWTIYNGKFDFWLPKVTEMNGEFEISRFFHDFHKKNVQICLDFSLLTQIGIFSNSPFISVILGPKKGHFLDHFFTFFLIKKKYFYKNLLNFMFFLWFTKSFLMIFKTLTFVFKH